MRDEKIPQAQPLILSVITQQGKDGKDGKENLYYKLNKNH